MPASRYTITRRRRARRLRWELQLDTPKTLGVDNRLQRLSEMLIGDVPRRLHGSNTP